MYVCPSGLGGNVIFSAPIKYRALIFCVHIPLVYEHLFYKYFVLGLSVRLQKAKEIHYLWMLSSLLFYFHLMFLSFIYIIRWFCFFQDFFLAPSFVYLNGFLWFYAIGFGGPFLVGLGIFFTTNFEEKHIFYAFFRLD